MTAKRSGISLAPIKEMKQTITILIFLIISLSGFATWQEPDLLIYKGDTIQINVFPLEILMDKDSSLRRKFLNQNCGSTDCWRMHIGIWKIENDSLFLIGLKDCCYNKPIPISEIFDNLSVKNNAVFAIWFTDSFKSGFGKILKFNEEKWEDEFEYYLELNILNGKVVKYSSTKK